MGFCGGGRGGWQGLGTAFIHMQARAVPVTGRWPHKVVGGALVPPQPLPFPGRGRGARVRRPRAVSTSMDVWAPCVTGPGERVAPCRRLPLVLKFTGRGRRWGVACCPRAPGSGVGGCFVRCAAVASPPVPGARGGVHGAPCNGLCVHIHCACRHPLVVFPIVWGDGRVPGVGGSVRVVWQPVGGVARRVRCSPPFGTRLVATVVGRTLLCTK